MAGGHLYNGLQVLSPFESTRISSADTPNDVSGRSKTNQIPNDILIPIFEYLGDVDIQDMWRETHYSGETTWKDTISDRRRLVQVCKSWWNAGLPLLYKDIYLHRIGQLPAFRKTLEQHLARFAQKPYGEHGTRADFLHTTQIIIDFYVPLEWENVYRRDLGRIFEICTNIREILINPSAGELTARRLGRLTKGASFSRAISTLNVDSALPNLTTLSFGLYFGHEDFWTLLPNTPFLRNLCSLEITLCTPRGYQFDIELPRLRKLALMIECDTDLTHINNWSLPCLMSVSLANLTTRTKAPKLLTVFGPQLKFFGYVDTRKVIPHNEYYDIDLQVVLQLCPNLEHLCGTSLGRIRELHHHIRRIDVCSTIGMSDTTGFSEAASEGLLPSLKAIGIPYFQDFFPDYPSVQEWANVARFIGVQLVNADSPLLVVQVEWEGKDDGDSSDGDYSNKPVSDGSSEYWEVDDSDIEMVDHDAGLEIFHAALTSRDQLSQASTSEIIESDNEDSVSDDPCELDNCGSGSDVRCNQTFGNP